MRNGSPETERRDGAERRREDRRKQSIPVAVERRSGTDRRSEAERRRQAAELAPTSE
jgi:hypothetical protein